MTVIINGTDNSASTPAVTGTDGDTGMFYPAANTVALSTGGSERMRVDSSGNVGIGTTSPAFRLDVAGTTAINAAVGITRYSGAGYLYFQSSRGSSVGTNTIVQDGDTLGILRFNGANGTDFTPAAEIRGVVDGTPGASNDMPGRLVFLTTPDGSDTPTERMRITSGGNLLLGTTTNTDNVKYVFSSSGGRAAQIITSSSNEWGLSIDIPNNYTDAAYLSRCSRTSGFDQFFFFVGQSNSVSRIQIRGDGNLLNTNNSYGGISDIRLKENIVDATPKLDDLMRVQVRHYNFIGDEQKQLGVIAQELEQIFPGMVEESPDRDTEGNDLGTTTKSVKYSVFVPMLVKAIQELKAINDAQAQRIETLEAKVAALEGAE
jgi:hypothetical protein